MKIVISKIPGDYPSAYNEQFYLNVRSVREGRDFFVAETAEKHQVKDDESYRKRKIQSVFYDKYTIEFMTTESIDIDKINVAGEIIITQDSGEQHLAEILDFQEPSKMQRSEFRLYTLTYRDLNSKETINHLSAFSFSEGIIRFKSGITNSYSPIYPKFDVTEYEKTENSDNYIQKISSDNAFKTIEFISYVSQASLVVIKRGMSATYLDTFIIEYDSVEYTALETPELIVEESELEDLIPIRVIMRYEQILNYPYE